MYWAISPKLGNCDFDMNHRYGVFLPEVFRFYLSKLSSKLEVECMRTESGLASAQVLFFLLAIPPFSRVGCVTIFHLVHGVSFERCLVHFPQS
jgi:hypothetical protein